MYWPSLEKDPLIVCLTLVQLEVKLVSFFDARSTVNS